MSEDDLADNLSKLITQLIDKETLSLFGWPDESVDVVRPYFNYDCIYSLWDSQLTLRYNEYG